MSHDIMFHHRNCYIYKRHRHKQQNIIESSGFGSGCVALKIATEMNEALRYKLRMMGIPIEGLTNCICDNKSVVINATIPQSTLKKKHKMIAHHKARRPMASEAAHEPGKCHLAVCLTTCLNFGQGLN
jgi:hypothetical protein